MLPNMKLVFLSPTLFSSGKRLTFRIYSTWTFQFLLTFNIIVKMLRRSHYVFWTIMAWVRRWKVRTFPLFLWWHLVPCAQPSSITLFHPCNFVFWWICFDFVFLYLVFLYFVFLTFLVATPFALCTAILNHPSSENCQLGKIQNTRSRPTCIYIYSI